jgi:hypothetical protein
MSFTFEQPRPRTVNPRFHELGPLGLESRHGWDTRPMWTGQPSSYRSCSAGCGGPLYFWEAQMNVINRVNRWLSGVAVTLAPLLVLVLPALILPGAEYTNAEDQARAFANNGFPYQGLVMQITGAVLLVPAVQGMAGAVFRRGRGVILGVVGLVIGMVASFALLLVLGNELGMAFIFSYGNDTEARVALAVAMGRWPVYGALLGVGFAAFLVALPILAVALWRGRVASIAVPLLFLLPIITGFVPLPPPADHLVPSFGLLLPCIWITVQLLRGPQPTTPITEAAVGQVVQPEENLSTSETSR